MTDFSRTIFRKRWVVSQKINLDSAETGKTFPASTENLKPEK